MAAGQVTGLEVCLANVKKIKKAFEAEAENALKKWGSDTINESKNSFCPVDTGEMKATGDYKVVKEGSAIWVILYYNTDYAPTVHEKPARHPIGQSGFLRTPFNSRIPKLESELKTGLSKAVK
jgi:hypothetical protein